MSEQRLIRAATAALAWRLRPLERVAPRTILVNGFMGIGDLVMFAGVIQGLRQAWPAARVLYLTGPRDRAVELLRIFGWADEVFSSGLTRKELAALRRSSGPIDLFAADAHMASIRILPLLNDVPMRLGIVSGGSFRLNYDRAFNLRVPCIDGEHSLERNLRLLDALGLGRPEWPWRSAAEWKARNPAPAGRSGIVLQPLSGPNVPGRDWPIDSFAGLARALLEAGVGPLCALAGAGQEARLERLPAEVRREIGLPLEQVCRRLMTARLVIGVDSGLAHLAALLGTPTLTLFGPTDETLVRPWGPLAQQLVADCPQRPCYRFGAPGRLRDCRDRICMSSIAVERAAERALQMLKQSAMTEAGDA